MEVGIQKGLIRSLAIAEENTGHNGPLRVPEAQSEEVLHCHWESLQVLSATVVMLTKISLTKDLTKIRCLFGVVFHQTTKWEMLVKAKQQGHS